MLPNAYTPSPGGPTPRYSLTQAHQALTFLARQMNQDHTRDLAWWRIPRWAPTRPRILASMVASGLLGGLLVGLVGYWLAAAVLHLDELETGLTNDLLQGLVYGLGVGLAYGRGGRAPKRIRNWRDISLRSVLTTGLTVGLTAGLAVMLINGPVVVLAGVSAAVLNTIPHRWLFQSLLHLVTGLVIGLLLGLKHDLPSGLGESEGSSPQDLGKSRRKDRVAGLVAGLAIGLAAGLAIGLAAGLLAGLAIVLGSGSRPGSRADLSPSSRSSPPTARATPRDRSKPGVMTECSDS